jgi:hypothetical protein
LLKINNEIIAENHIDGMKNGTCSSLLMGLVAESLFCEGLFVVEVICNEDTALKFGAVPAVNNSNVLAKLAELIDVQEF